MRVYLDNCCYNRPFDEQVQPAVRLETEAKLFVQSLMKKYVVEYAWSFVLRMEISRNPDFQRKKPLRIGRRAQWWMSRLRRKYA